MVIKDDLSHNKLKFSFLTSKPQYNHLMIYDTVKLHPSILFSALICPISHKEITVLSFKRKGKKLNHFKILVTSTLLLIKPVHLHFSHIAKKYS